MPNPFVASKFVLEPLRENRTQYPSAPAVEGVETAEGRMRLAFNRALREPLATVRSVASALRPQVGEALAPQLEAIVDAAKRADGTLRDLLEFLENSACGGIAIHPRRTDLILLCERVLDSIQRDHPAHAIAFSSTSRVLGDWDPDRIEELLSRLVQNAIEHGPAQRVIRVGLSLAGNQVVLEVWNAGSMIEPADVPKLFEPFSGREGRGLGVGLYLAREIVRAHRGSIDVECEAAGGTAFRVTLPGACP
jgi:signal transduction histidine kinase